MIEACSDAVPSSGCGGARLQAPIELLQLVQHAAHPHDRVAPFARTAAVRGAPARLDLEPREALVADRDLQVGRLGDHGGVGAPAADQRVGADAGVLLVHDAPR